MTVEGGNGMTASAQVVARMREAFTFQISVDVDAIALGLNVARAALAGGVDLIEMGTPLLKCVGVYNVVPAFRAALPEALLLADMKTMDGGWFEAQAVYGGGGNIIDFLAASGVATAKGVCGVRDRFRAEQPEVARLAFADILVPHQGPAARAVEVADAMVAAGVDGVGIHLQLDARRADPEIYRSNYLADVAEAVFERVGSVASVQVVGGLSIAQAKALAHKGLRAFVISGNMGVADAEARFGLPAAEIERLVRGFIAEVSAG